MITVSPSRAEDVTFFILKIFADHIIHVGFTHSTHHAVNF